MASAFALAASNCCRTLLFSSTTTTSTTPRHIAAFSLHHFRLSRLYSSRRNVIHILEERGLLDSLTSDALRRPDLPLPPLRVYCGFDPTARVSTSAIFSALLFSPGSSAAATKPSPSSAAPPAASATPPSILGRVSTPSSVTILNNYDWWKDVKLLDFLREVGRFARVGTMMSKESVRKRLESDQGMSYTEFTYQLLQGYDFLRLFRDEGVNVQIGGSDQWGNITAGTDLIRRILQTEGAYGLTFPLLLKSDGTKFGKSEDGAIWLSPSLLSLTSSTSTSSPSPMPMSSGFSRF
ncbi:UNVERIFIED_CONTAM: Tyrosine--tRNA ligase, chloroplastic/mitochondrial [Sesamum radiatum]|uniref:Tyrosine--tRNA ligase n=1 Tax=Sesamum radiatum TaxID=300843 RepID=A0AAW2TV37_SESRA